MRFLDLNPLSLGECGAKKQPGLSMFREGKWVHGEEALAHCRVDPQSVRFDVWDQLSLTPQGLPGGMRHLADLALGQLREICREPGRGEWVVFTPVMWQKEQLQIFLGTAAACGMDVRVLLPRVLAVNHNLTDTPDRWTAWEWHWQQLLRVELWRDVQGWQVREAVGVPEGGVVDLFRKEARAVAKYALEQHRIDPLHSGQTEQQLFAGWWQRLDGAAQWGFRAGELRLDVLGMPLSAPTLKGTADEPSASAPARLKRVLGWQQTQTEREDVEAVASRLGDLDQPGARRRHWLPVTAAAHRTALPVTHVVVDGIARKREVPEGVLPGDRVTLPDGNEGLAVHVAEG